MNIRAITQRHRGFSILEILVALFIVTVGMFVFSSIFASNTRAHIRNISEFDKVNIRQFLQQNLNCSETYYLPSGEKAAPGTYRVATDIFGNTISTGEDSQRLLLEKYNLRFMMADSLAPATNVEARFNGTSVWTDLFDGIPLACDCQEPTGWTEEWYASSGVSPDQNGSNFYYQSTTNWFSPTFSGSIMSVNHGGDRQKRTAWATNVTVPCGGTAVLEARIRIGTVTYNENNPRAPIAIFMPYASSATNETIGVHLHFYGNVIFARSAENTRTLTINTVDTNQWHTYRIEGFASGQFRLLADGVEVMTGMGELFGGPPDVISFGDHTNDIYANTYYEFIRHNLTLR